MKELYIRDIKKDTEITEFFIVKAASLKTGSNGKTYLDITLGDNSGEISGKKWDVSPDEQQILGTYVLGDLVKIKAQVTEWAGAKQLRINRIRKANDADGLDIRDYLKAAPEDPEKMYAYILETAEGFYDKDLRNISVKVLTDNRERLLYYPAASKNHHAELGGLLYHMKRMLMNGDRMCEVYTNLNRDLVLTGVILHDMEKLNEILAETDGISSGYSFEGQMLGHLVMGVKSIDRMALELGMSDEKRIMLEHMILTHHYEPEFGSPKKPMFPEAEILHYLDIIDARMYDMDEVLDVTDAGEFSEKVWTLDNRRIYKAEEF